VPKREPPKGLGKKPVFKEDDAAPPNAETCFGVSLELGKLNNELPEGVAADPNLSPEPVPVEFKLLKREPPKVGTGLEAL